MFQMLRTAFLMLIVLTVLTGCVYPLIVTILAQFAFPYQSQGSWISKGDRVIGSEWIGQQFNRPEYFWGRLSATATVPYNAAPSSGSNFGPLHPKLVEAAQARIAAMDLSGNMHRRIPVDLVTASASGLDPHISPAAAEFQVQRVARSRKMSEARVREIVGRITEERQFGILGERRINVLRLNLALDAEL